MSLNIQMSKDGYRVLQVEEQGKVQYIGSRYCQKREIDRFVAECLKNEYNSIYVVFGLGFAEHIQQMINFIGPEAKILIIELNKDLVDFCEKDKDIKKIVSDERVAIAGNAAGVKSFFDRNIDEINIGRVKLNYYCRYDRIYADRLQSIYDMIRNETERITTNRNTILHFGQEWTKCMIKNLRYIADGIPVNNLKDKYKNVPAVIVSAGPSLEKNIDLLKNFDKGLIISGGRTLKPLAERSIKPDLLCVMDSGEVSYKLVEDYLNFADCPLVFSESSNSDVVNEHKGKKIFSANNSFISEICGEYIQTLSGGGSVAHSMTLLAAYMGCSPIIFIGQDLAYTGEKGHASFAKNAWQNMTFNDYKRTDDIYVSDINGEPVRTSLILNRYRIALQNIIKLFPDVTFINATEGGAKIEGTENRKLSEVILNIKKRCIPAFNFKAEDYSQRISDKLEEVRNNISKYEELYEKRKDIVSEAECIDYETLDRIDIDIRHCVEKLGIMKDMVIKCRFEAENVDDFKVLYDDSKEEKRIKSIAKKNYIYSLILNDMQKIKEEI